MRWLCGPLDASRLEKEKKAALTADSKELLQRWLDPGLLDLLRGTPVDCVVVNWAAGLPADAEQQKALAPLVAKGKAARLSFLGLVSGSADVRAAAASASAAGLDGILTEGTAPQSGIRVVPVAERSKLPWDSPSSVLVPSDAVWPGIPSAAQAGTESGPTSDPWIDSNGWALRLSRVIAPAKKIWMLYDPPGKPSIVSTESLVRAVADACSFGGQWVVSLDENLRSDLARNDAKSLDAWKTVVAAMAFFKTHAEWVRFQPLGAVGVISDFAGPNELLGTETLNLLARRHVAYRVVEKSQAAAASLAGFKALVAVDEALPDPPLRNKLLAFAERGGVLMLSQSWKGVGGTPTGQEHPRIEIRTLGKGKIAISKDASPDPYMVARDTHVLLGKAHDLSRFYNISAFISNYTALPGSSRAVMQFTNYAQRITQDLVTVWFRDKFSSARLWTIGSSGSTALGTFPENGGTCVELPSIPTYAAVELAGIQVG
jgi:hypothetical protein